MSNFTTPNERNHEDQPADWVYSALFAQALSYLIPNNVGILFDVRGVASEEIGEHVKRVIVWNDGTKIKIINASERKEKNGTRLTIIDPDVLKN